MTPQSPARGVHAPRTLVRRSAAFLVAVVFVGGGPLVAQALTEEPTSAPVPAVGALQAITARTFATSAPRPNPAIPDLGANLDAPTAPSTSPRRPHRSSRKCRHPHRCPTSGRPARRRASGPPCASASPAATTRSRAGQGSIAARTSSIVRRGTRSPSATLRSSSASTRRRPRPPIRTHWPSPCTASAALARGRTAAVTWADVTSVSPQPSVMMG